MGEGVPGTTLGQGVTRNGVETDLSNVDQRFGDLTGGSQGLRRWVCLYLGRRHTPTPAQTPEGPLDTKGPVGRSGVVVRRL